MTYTVPFGSKSVFVQLWRRRKLRKFFSWYLVRVESGACSPRRPGDVVAGAQEFLYYEEEKARR